MTMTSVAVGPVSLGTPPPMLTTKRYHLQQGMTPNSASPTPTKNYETLSKGKKSWSVRLGLSRQHQSTDDATKNWGTISGGSALSRQMLYGEPWIYGTVRSTRGCIDQCNFSTPTSSSSSGLPPQLAGTPILVICSCPEFLSGTTRKLGNCRKCGGHRLARIPLGGTCRIPETSSRIRPSLAGVLRPSVDDPYDLMRRSRLVEPRSRARSISPNRQANQRDTRSQSVRTAIKDRKSSNDGVSRTEWFDTEINYDDSSHKTRPITLTTAATTTTTTISTTTSSTTSGTNEWNVNDTTDDSSRNLSSIRTKKNRLWQQEPPPVTKNNENWNDKKNLTKLNNSTNNIDSRKSILECNVNPYLLVKKQLNLNNDDDDDDDLSDDLSDNALEHEEKIVSSSLFDPSKVKSIERLPNHSAVAAIGGQRIRVFTEIRELSDDDNNNNNDLPVTKIPIPKISPKRPPRRPKETKIIIKSILKRGNKTDGYCKKNVFFNINNVILSPDKTTNDNIPLTIRKINKNLLNEIKEDKKIPIEHEKPIVVDDKIHEKPKFITIPNIKELKRIEKPREKIHEARIIPDVKNYPTIDRKIDKNILKHPEIPARNKRLSETGDIKKENSIKINDTSSKKIITMNCNDNNKKQSEITRDEDETDLEIEIEELKDQLPDIGSDEKELILKANDNSKRSSLTRSQSDKSLEKFEKSTTSLQYLDTMRLSLRRAKDSQIADVKNSIIENDETEIKNQNTPVQLSEKEAEPPPYNYSPEYFQRMRPTSWSPPGKTKTLSSCERVNDPGAFNHTVVISKSSQKHEKNNEIIDKNLMNDSYIVDENKSKIKIISPQIENNNICKITVTPRSSPLVHRLQVGGCNEPPRGSRRTSILINSDLTSDNDSTINDNKVTISVGGEDSICNPTVISVNSTSTPKIKNSMENRTLVILENYKSNIVLESTKDDKLNDKNRSINNSIKIFDNDDDDNNKNSDIINNKSEWSDLTRESIISKLLEDSLKKARENGEILDESSGEAILRILKQSLLKNKQYENNNSDIEFKKIDNYEKSTCDFVTKNIFLDENPYEIIKEPIYEEIPDEPPPLPLSPPPIEDRIYFPPEYKESYYKKVNAGQYLGSYLTDDEFNFKKKTTTSTLPTTTTTSSSSSSSSSLSATKTVTSLSSSPADDNLTRKFELLNFLMDAKERPVAVEEDEMVDDEDEDDDEEEDVEDTEGDLEALYEQKETSMGDLSSKSSQISNVSDSSEECNIILTSSTEASKTRTVDIERTDSGVGSESSQASSSSRGVARRWRTGNATSSGPASLRGGIPQVISADAKLCEDCEQRLDPLITDSCVVYAPFVCRKCSKKRAERKEIITEIVETEQKYGRDLRIILEEFHRPMLRAGLLTQEQLSAIFLNVEELLEHNLLLADKLKEAVEFSQVSGDEDLLSVDLGKIFIESERMLHAFESYCTRQGGASLLLQNLEKEKELLRIFLKVSQMENTVLRRMNLNSFLMVPVQRVTKYPLLLARLLKTTPSIRLDVQETRKRLEQAQANIELHLEHMNAEAKDVTSTKLWRRISIIQNGRRSNGEHDIVNIKLRKMAVEVLEWAHEEARFVLEGRLLVAQPTDNNWKRGRTVKLAPVTAMLVTNGKSNTEFLDTNDDSLFPRQIGIKEATLLLVKEKIGRYSLLREPLCLDKCIVCCETDLEDYFEIQELSTKETFIFKAEDGARTKRWCRTLQAHAQSLGAWRRRRGALPNIMICGVARS